jgi:hypothetical protein
MSLKTKIAMYRVKRLLTEVRQLTELKTYEGKLARIVGKPFATRLDKPYPRSALGRSALAKAIEMSNNAEMLGFAKANVNGEPLRGFYFRATDGSAKGVAWQAAVDVYRAKQVGPDLFFAHDSRIGTKLQPESVEPSEPDTIDDEDEEDEDEEECDCEDEDCDCDDDVEEGCKGKKKKAKPVAEMGPDADKSAITEKVGTKLIQRAVRGLGAGASEMQVAKELQKSGVSKEEAFLAIKAAKILIGDVMKGESKDTKPLPPLHKWPVKIVGKGKVEYTLGTFRVTEVGEPPGSGLYIYELFSDGKSAGKFNNQREVVSKAQALRGK